MLISNSTSSKSRIVEATTINRKPELGKGPANSVQNHQGNFQDSMADTVQNMDSWSTSQSDILSWIVIILILICDMFIHVSDSSRNSPKVCSESNHVQRYAELEMRFHIRVSNVFNTSIKALDNPHHQVPHSEATHRSHWHHGLEWSPEAVASISRWNDTTQNHPGTQSQAIARASFIPCQHTLLNRLVINLWHRLVDDLRDKWLPPRRS